MSVWDVHYRSTTNGDSLDVGAFHIRESEDHDFGGFVHATADCSSPSSLHKSVSLLLVL